MPTDTSILHKAVQTALREHGIQCQVLPCDPDLADTALFCQNYNFLPEQAANAIIGASKGEPTLFACCLVLANCRLDVNKKLRQLLNGRKASFASAEQTLALTGMQIGGVTPIGLPSIPIYIDAAVMDQVGGVIIGGGNRSSKILVAPAELLKLPGAEVVSGLANPK